MSTGVGPQLPESGWNIDYAQALEAWLRSHAPNLPPMAHVTAVMGWIEACKLVGPPAGARRVKEDRYVAPVEGTRLFVEYLVIEYEYLVLVKDFH